MKRVIKRITTILTALNDKAGILKPVMLGVAALLAIGWLAWLLESATNSQFLDVFDGLWWAIITFSTTGYGDKVPMTLLGRILTTFTVFFGIISMGLLSGSLASFLVDRNNRVRRGLMEFRKIKDHLIICGWKVDMEEILRDILNVSSDFTADKIILISNVEPERISALQEFPELKNLKFVRGDYFSESALRRASVTTARKVLILSDTLESQAASEVDSKTVMTVITVKSLARDVYVCAEVMDKKFESYLKHAQCDEILFSREFSQRLLANASTTSGLSHILHELLTQEISHTRLCTRDIEPTYIGKTYGEFRHSFGGAPNRIIVGILENTGSPNRMKIESLREAQKTSDVSRLVNNLQKVKELEVNRPVLLPPDEYVVQLHSQVIVLEKDLAGRG